MTRQYYPLTHPQKRIWFGEKLTPGYDFATIAGRITIQGPASATLLSQALNRILEKNAGLRLRFVELEGEGDAFTNTRQYVADYQPVKILILDFSHASLAEVDDWCLAESAKPFQLLDADLYQFAILKTADSTTLFLKFHHLIADGLSCWGPFLEQLISFYTSLINKVGFEDKPIVSYLNFIEEEAAYQESALFAEDRQFWLEKFADPLEEQPFYLDKGPASDLSVQSLTCHIPDELWQALKQFSRENKTPPFRLLLTGLYLYFARIGQHYDQVLDLAHHNRNQKADLQTIGMFVSTVPLRLTLDPETSFLDALRIVSQELETVLKGPQRFPYNLLVEALRTRHGTGLNSACSISQVRLPSLPGMDFRHYQNTSATEPLSLFIYPNGDFGFLFQRACFSAADIEALFNRLLTLLQDALTQPERPLWQLNLLPAVEQQQLLQDFNATALPVPTDRTFPELFAEQVARTPDRLALVYRDERYTYQQLDAKTNALARVLRDRGVQPDAIVPILLHRSAEMLIAALAIMKAGGAYLPVDADYPQPRIDFMLADSGATLLVSQIELREKAGAFTGLWLDIHDQALYAGGDLPLWTGSRPERLAYVIYTSGSTGQPKGVLIEQRNLVNVCFSENRDNALTAEDAFANFASFSFDTSVTCLFPPLLVGAAVHIAPEELRLAPELLSAWFEEQGITLCDFPTQFGEQFMQLTRNRSLRLLIVGGDQLKGVTPQSYTLVNEYGPTECTVVTTRFQVDPTDVANIPIGRPVANTQAYVVDAHGQLQPIGVPGELWLGGAQVARGYWNRPELTAEKFIADPFASPLPVGEGPGARSSRVYRTGDIVRWRADGNLEFIGRRDFQIKIRGFRVELGDIEAALRQHPEVADAAVISGQNAGGTAFIAAYAVLRDSQGATDQDDLRRFLAERLPDYMVPARLGLVPHLPMTTHGKLDRQALLATLPPETTVDRITPRNDREQILADIWQEVLRLEEVGVTENFFHLGGDSIMSIQILSRARSRGLGIKGAHFFAHPTIAGLAEVAETLAPASSDHPAEGLAQLLPIQRWFFALASPEPHYFNQSFCLKPRQPLTAAFLEQALECVGRHHDALRLRFQPLADGAWEQRYAALDTPIFRFTEVDLRPVAESERTARQARLLDQLQHGFDLQHGPLAAAILAHGWTAGEQRLLIAAHHLVVDVVSWRILLEDLESAYSALERGQAPALPPRTAAYAEWGAALQRYAQSPALAEIQPYWTRISENPPPLKRDRDAPLPVLRDTATLTLHLPMGQTAPLLEKPFGLYRARANDVLLTALTLAIFRWSGAREWRLDLEGHGREEEIGQLDVSRTVGWFTSLFPVRLRLPEHFTADPAPTDLVRALLTIKETLRGIPGNGISYGVLRYLGAGIVHSPDPEVSFNYLGSLAGDPRAFLAFSDEASGEPVAPDTPLAHLLEIDGWESGGELTFLLRYSLKHFDPATIQALAAAFQSSLEHLSALFAPAVTRAFSPADFPHTGLSQSQLDQLAATGDIEDIYRLTPLQEGILFHTCLHPEAGEYLTQTHWRFLDPVDLPALRQAWTATMRHHPVFRTAFAWEDLPAPVQIVYATVDFEWVELDWREIPEDQFPAQFQTLLDDDRRRGFDLRRPGLTRVILIRRPEGDRLVWTDHHILTDGWCLPLLLGELNERTVALREHRAPRLESAPPFARMIDWLFQQDRSEAEQFWRQQVGDLEAPSRLGIEKAGVNLADRTLAAQMQEREQRLSVALTARCTEFARQMGCTINTLLQTAWAMSLAVSSGQDDLTFGMVSSGRPGELPGVEKIIGLFISSAPMRIRLDDPRPVREAIQAIAQTGREVNRLSFIGLEQIRALSRVRPPEPLFHSIFAFENYPVTEYCDRSDGLRLGDIASLERADMPLALVIFPGEGITVRAAFNDRLIEAAGIEQLLELYPQAIEGLLNHPERSLSALVDELAQAAYPDRRRGPLALLSAEEQQRILVDFNANSLPVPTERTFPDLFAEQVAKTPDRLALAYQEDRYTYQQLDAKTNALARVLRDQGVQPDAIVPIMLHRSAEILIAALAIMKAGGAYLPVDPDYPQTRIDFMLADSGATLLLSETALREKAGAFTGAWLDLRDPALYAGPGTPLKPRSRPEHLAYVIYTSGSTGQPKGVLIEQRNLVNMCFVENRENALTAEDAFAIYASFGFDSSVIGLFSPLLGGAAVHIVPEELRLAPEALSAWFEEHHVTLTILPTQFGEQFMQLTRNQSLRMLIMGGEKLKLVTPQSYRVMNEYGPTECTVVATRFQVDPTDVANIPIGRPLANTQAYVVNPQGQLQPIGVPGELWLGGAQVARGYWNRPELTAEKFIANPFDSPRPEGDGSGARASCVYRTGDIVRWLPDGNLEFIGRRDFQIKIRGFRVELGEIDQALIQHPAVHDAIVIAREDPSGGHYLCGYYVSAPPVEPAEIKAFLGCDLPAYMIPAFLMPLPALPVNTHGKVDRKALPDPHQGVERPYLAPRNETEEQIAAIWQDLLHPGRSLSLDDDFFALGGNSLKVMALAARLEKAFGVKLALADLFNRPILQDLAADMTQRARRQRYTPIAPLPERDYYPTSAVQKRMYVLQSLPGVGSTYNIPQTLLLEGPLDSARLAETLDRLVERHEILRTRFTLINGDIVQQAQLQLRYKKLFKEVPEADLAEALNEFCQPFDLSEAPLFRMGLFKLAPERHLLIIDMHHSISDGASSLILFDELFTLYEGGALPPMPIQYRDFAAWQNQLLDSPVMQTHEAYWLTTLAGELPVLQLPTDRPRPAHQQFSGASIEFALDEALVAQLTGIAQRTGGTLFMMMLAAYQVLLSKYAGQEDLIIGTVASGRTHPDTENLIGMFVTTLPIRSFPQADKPFVQYLHEVRQAVLDALEHQDYPFDRIVENLHLPRDPSRNPLFTASFGLLAAESIQQAAQLTIRPYPIASTASHFDLSLDIGVQTDRIDGYFNYATHLFDAATIERMAGHFVRLLQQIAADPELRLGEIELMSAEERQRLLVDFNATGWPVPTDRTFPELFAEQAAKTPDRPALVYRDQRYTYQQLDAKTNALARVLRDRGVRPDAIVPILLQRSAEMLIAALAIMKAGGAYLPVDPEYPQARIDFMLADSGATLLLSETALRAKVGAFTGAWLDVHDPALDAGPETPLEPLAGPEHLAYVIYTSGSTGQPKGVLIEQRNLVNLCIGENAANATTAEDAVANHYSFSFDSAVSCLFPPLLVGAAVHLIPDELRLAPDALSAYFEAQGITITDFPTQFGEQFMQLTRNQSLRLLLMGGERLKTAALQPYTLINAYGPTECTVTATRFIIDRADYANIPIGRPVANTQAYVVNARGQLQPIGVPGELWLGGAQVARGYWNRPELTAEKFIDNPFAAANTPHPTPPPAGVRASRVYRTGDIVRWRPDGTLEFSARQDHQVKIRGFRVELGEIEQVILSLPAVRETVVVALDDDHGNQYLAGYLVAEPPTLELDLPALRQTLQKTLPDYLIPAHFVQLEHLPLTVNGKVDTRALPKPSATTEEIVRGYIAPRNELEQTLATVWAAVLGVKNVGIHDNFFALGGNSLQAITLIARLQKHFVVTINDLYQWQTIAELAPKIKPRQDYLNLFLNELKENPEAWADPLAANPGFQAQLGKAQQQYRQTWARYEHLDLTARRRYQNLLLTGATGFLGAYLLHELLRQPETSGLVVIVRGADQADAAARLRSKFAYYFGAAAWDDLQVPDRITVLCGDLSQPQFGLSADEYQHWTQQIDGILNSAANVRHYGHYQEFYQANVQSVINLIDFAQTGVPKDLHHISTLSVASGAFPDRDYVVFTEDNADEGQVSGNHYLTTKLAAEKLLIDRRADGLNASIYRVGNIVFSEKTGRYQENIEDNAFFSQMQSFVNLGVTPAMKDDIDFTYVDSLAQAILRLMYATALRNETWHLANPRRLRLSEVLNDPGLGLAVSTVPFADFVDTLLNHLEQWGFSHHIENILTHMGWLGGELEQQTLVTPLADRTEFLLERLGFNWPALTLPNLLPMLHQALAERIAFMAQTPLFAQLTPEQQAILAGQATMTAFRNEKPLVWEGDPSDALYLVMNGYLEISSTSTSGWTGTLGVMGEKDFIGEESLFPGKRAILTAEALLGDVVALQFPGAILRAMIQQHPQLALNLIEALETRLQRLAKLVISIS